MTGALLVWVVPLVIAVVFAVIFHRALHILFRLCLRSCGALALLTILNPIGGFVGITLGINCTNALVMAVLGVPGLGLLLMLQWILQ